MSYRTPDEWLQSEYTTSFFGQLASAPHSLLLLDYDGTLAPFTADRLHAIPYPGVKERLERLATLPRTRVILISGRKARELRDLLDVKYPLEIWGSHGREYLQPDGTYRMDALTLFESEHLHRLKEALQKDFDASVVEVKPSSVAVHWRTPPSGIDPSLIRRRMEELVDQLPSPRPGEGILQLLSFDGGLELRAGLINKGHAVEKVLAGLGDDMPAAFLGDDVTDEDAFAVLKGRGLAVLVRTQPRLTQARLWLSPPEDLFLFLDAWTAAVENPL